MIKIMIYPRYGPSYLTSPIWTRDNDDKLRRHWNNGYSIHRIAYYLRCTASDVFQRVNHLELGERL